MTDLQISLSAIAIVIVPGITAWINLREKVVRLEERVKMHEENNGELKKSMEKITDQLTELRDLIMKK